ncbi:MAG TPA: hypothetical protein VE870_15740 [Bacteroidales bacterium]|nr:hypothetical protein [Bacteroidales bacterium]
MIPDKIDHRRLHTLTDVKLAREKLKYAIALQEQEVTKGFANLGGSIIASLRSSAYSIGVKLAFAIVSNLMHRNQH